MFYFIIISHINSPDLAVTVFMVLSENIYSGFRLFSEFSFQNC